MRQLNGVVVSLNAGFYDVQTEEGIIRTRARGLFRQRKEKPAVGDQVEIQVDDQGMSYLVKLDTRLNLIGRPAVANVNEVLLVMSAVEPDFSLALLDRFLTFFAWKQVNVSIYLSKTDLASKSDLEQIAQILAYYNKIGYRSFVRRETLAAELPQLVGGQIWTLAGQSGAGKSTLLNFLKAGAKQETAAISTSLNRGKHTTRTVQLFTLGSGLIADTPGFSAIDLSLIKLNELGNYFIEFKKFRKQCKFRGCQHLKEPGCEIKRLVKIGEIAQSRYDNYLLMREEIVQSRVPEYRK